MFNLKKYQFIFQQSQYETTLVGAILMLVIGTLYGWPAASLPQLLDPNSEIKASTSDGSWLAAMPSLGTVVGAITAANLVDRIGRKPCLLMISPLLFLSWIMIAGAGSIYVMFAARLVAGAANGLTFSVYPMYLGEVANPKVRGTLCGSMPVSASLGQLFISVIGPLNTIQSTALIISIFPVVHFVLLFFMPESPYFLLMKNRREEATKNLIKLRGVTNANEEIERLCICIKEDCENKADLWALFRIGSNRRACYVILILRFLQQFSGQMAIIFYVTIIFRESGSALSPPTCTSIYFGVQLICSLVCTLLIDKIGRRPMLMVSTTGSALILSILGGYFYLKECSVNLEDYTWIPIVALLSYEVFFSLGLSNVPTVILGELFPTSVMAFALCLADVYFGFLVFASTKFFQIMSDIFGMSVPFFVFSGGSICALIYTLFWLPETKGKTLEEIQGQFQRRNNMGIEQTDL